MTSFQKLGGFLIGSIFVGAGTAALVRTPTTPVTSPPFAVASVPVVTPAPTNSREVHASDGTMNLTLVKNRTSYGTDESLSVSDISGGNKHQIFQKTYTNGGITLPANSWSPDNKYVFVEESGSNPTFLVMKATGEPFADGQAAIDVGAQFAEKLKDLKLKTITGWADMTLLIVTTTKEDGTRGGTYWFDVSYRNFLLLRG